MLGACPRTTRQRAAWSGMVLLVLVAWVLARPGGASAVVPPSLEDEAPAAALDVTLTPDRSGTVTPDAPFTWAGTVASGQNQAFDPAEGGPCGKTADTYCDVTLVDVVPGDFYSRRGGGVEFSTGGARAGTDLDLYVFSSDATGRLDQLVGVSGGPTDEERVSVVGASGWYAVVTVYFNATDTGYDGARSSSAAIALRPTSTPPRVCRISS
jgi:hypothetical protein